MASTSEMERKRVNPTINKAQVGSLKKYVELIPDLPLAERVYITAKYGCNIIRLLDVDVQAEAIHTLAQFYDFPMRCFTFRDFQMTPTLEEYSQILGYSLREIDTKPPYKCMKKYSSKLGDIAAVLGVTKDELMEVIKDQHQIKIIPQEYLEKRMEDLANKRDWKSFMDVLALTIYGIVLFPRINNYVDMAAIDVFMAVKLDEENPVPAILADTYCTLAYLHEENKKAKLRCCLPMLYVWLTAHVFMRKGSYNYRAKNPIEDFKMCDEVQKMNNKALWIQHLSNLKGETIRWFPRWEEEICEVIYQCGNYQNVPLIGTKGCIDYNPFFGLRQLGYSIMNHPPNEGTMTPFVVYEKEMIGSTKLKACREAWGRVIRKGKTELGKRSCGAGVDYQNWLKARVQNIKLPYSSSFELIDDHEAPPVAHSDHGNEEELEKLRSTLLKALEDNRKLQKELDEKDISLERSMKMAEIEKNQKLKYKEERDEALEEVNRLKSQLKELTKCNQ